MKIFSIFFEKVKENYMVLFCIYFVTIFLDTTTLRIDFPILETVCKIIRYIIYSLFIIRTIMVLPDIKKNIIKLKISKENIVILTFILFFIISIIGNFVITGEKRLIFLSLVLIASYNVDYDKIIKNMTKLQIILTTFIVALSIMGITQNYIVYRGIECRYSLGFGYTTSLAQLVLFSILLAIYKKEFKLNIIEIFYIQLINLFTYFITDSRAELIFLEFIIIISFIYNIGVLNKIERIKKYASKTFAYTFWTYPVLSFFIIYLYSVGGIFEKINKILSNRLLQSHNILKQYGVKLFGNNIEFIGNGIADKLKYGPNVVSNYVDNEYLQLLFLYGMLFICILIILVTVMLISLERKGKYKEIFVCFIYLTFGLLNPRIINLIYSPIPFILMHEIIKCLKKKE